MNMNIDIDKLKADLQTVQAHRRAALENIHKLEEKIAIVNETYPRQFVNATVSGNPPDEVFLQKWEQETKGLQSQYEQAAKVAAIFSEKEREIQNQIAAAEKHEYITVFNAIAAQRGEINARIEKHIAGLVKNAKQLHELEIKQRSAAAAGKLGVVPTFRPLSYVKEFLIQQLYNTPLKLEEPRSMSKHVRGKSLNEMDRLATLIATEQEEGGAAHG